MFKVLLCFLGLNLIGSLSAKVPNIKVRIADSQKKVLISGIDLKKEIKGSRRPRIYNGKKSFLFNCHSKTRKRGYSKPIKLASIESKTKLLNWNGEKFKGKIHIQTSQKFNGCDVINETSLEDYLSTLLAKEMNTSWPIEALKAQAVAARSYALYKIKTKQVSKAKGFNTYYDLENSEKHQVNGSFLDATVKTSKATSSTKGEILTWRSGKIIPIFFHSKCGGKTRLPEQVWSNKIKGYQSVNCPYCHDHGKKKWNYNISYNKFMKSIGKILRKDGVKVNSNKSIRLIDDRLKSSMVKLYVDDEFTFVKKSKLRTTLGRKTLPSNYFLLAKSKKRITAIGSGYGHGVGLCQFGAKELALQGYSYKQILTHYFPQLRIKKLYK